MNRRTSQKRPKTMADVIMLAPTASAEYILFNGLGSAVSTTDIERRVEALELDRKTHSETYKRIAIVYLKAELERRGVNL